MSKIKAWQIKKALERRHTRKKPADYFITEVKNGPTQIGNSLLIMDAVAIARSWSHPCITGYEVKVSRGDFLQDTKWEHYLRYCHQFSFVCPVGMIKVDELPEDIGLIWYDPEKDSLKTKRKPKYRNIEYDANFLMYIIMSRLQEDRWPGYESNRDYFKAWLDQRITDKELSYKVNSRLIDRNAQLEDENERLKKQIEYATESTDAIDQMLLEHGIMLRRDLAIKQLLQKDIPNNVVHAVQNLEKNLTAIMKWINTPNES